MIDSSNNDSYFNSLNLECISQETNNKLFHLDLGTINNIVNHYLCAQCFKFPFIKFCKDRKHIRLTCSCFNNKKILIKDLFEKNFLTIENNNNTNLLSTTNLNLNDGIEDKLLCKKHTKKFIGFSKINLDNFCQSCIDDYNNKYDNIIKFDDIKIEDIKVE